MNRFYLIVPLLALSTIGPALAAPVAPTSKPISPLALAGYQPLSGEGIVVTLSDQNQIPINKSGVALGLVHDFDVLKLVNELRIAGAQGISINGVRLTNLSSVRCIGPLILVDGKKVSVPLRVEAIGKAAQLKSRLQARDGIVNSWKATGPSIQIKASSKLQLRAASLPKSR